VGAPCGVMDQMASLLGREGKLLALLCQPAEPLAHVDIPASLAVWGIDSGIRHAVSGADYGSVRVGAFMGYRLMERHEENEAQRQEASGKGGAPVRLGAGYLSNVLPSEFEQRFSAALPESLSGAEFLAQFPHGTGDSVTSVDGSAVYAVRQPAKHPVYEHFRVKAFAELLHGEPVAVGPFSRQVELLGELMFQSHQSYSACGLGTSGTDLIVELVRRAGITQGLYGAKITGGGSGGTVAVLGHVGASEAIDEVVAAYEQATGHTPHVFTGSSPGALAFGHLRLRPL